MSETISRIAAGFVVKGDTISKGGTVFVYEVIEEPATEHGYTTMTIKEQIKYRPITARWKVPKGQIVSIHNRTPQPKGRVERDPSKRGVKATSYSDQAKAVGDAVSPETKAINAHLNEMAKDIPVVSLPEAYDVQVVGSSKMRAKIVAADPLVVKELEILAEDTPRGKFAVPEIVALDPNDYPS